VSETGAVERPDPEGSADTPGLTPVSVARQSNAVTAEVAAPPRRITFLDGPTEGTIGETLVVAMVR
jgi:hypothetical protein